jgi:hypothetical protein
MPFAGRGSRNSEATLMAAAEINRAAGSLISIDRDRLH